MYIHLFSDIFLAQYSIFLGGFLKLSRKHESGWTVVEIDIYIYFYKTSQIIENL